MIRTSLLLFATLVFAATTHADLINEWEPNPVGGDPAMQNVELLGTPGANFNLWLLSIEGEGPQIDPSGLGQIDEAANLVGTYDSNGLAVILVDDFENPTNTLVLTDAFTGTVGDAGTDVDTDNDGTVDDTSFFGTIMDAIGITDNEGSTVNFLYGAQLGGADFAYTGDEPGLIFRDSLTQAWYAINDPAGTDAFDINANSVPFSQFNQDPSVSTFGGANPFVNPVPEPSTTLFGAALVALGMVRRRKA